MTEMTGTKKQMSKTKHHSAEEVSAKLKRADVLIRQGFGQADIARNLGISVMTLHRWRKGEHLPLRGSTSLPHTHERPSAGFGAMTKQTTTIAELLEENTRLRRLVTDLLLEKMRIEESAA